MIKFFLTISEDCFHLPYFRQLEKSKKCSEVGFPVIWCSETKLRDIRFSQALVLDPKILAFLRAPQPGMT